MFTVYHSNDLVTHKEMLLKLMEIDPLNDPFQAETILVQSPGMAQWLQLQIAEQQGIAANFNFPMPASFIWQQYQNSLPNVTEQTQFNKQAMTWRLMDLLKQVDFLPLRQYFHLKDSEDQAKLYQLASKIADLFDQYLVYRPEWILAWEKGEDEKVEQAIASQQAELMPQILPHIQWQAQLWRALVQKVKEDSGITVFHRAHLHQNYLNYLAQNRPTSLPPRLFIFGISALPQSYLETFKAMSEHCHIHLFFNNPCRYYWGDIMDPHYLQRLLLRKRHGFDPALQEPLFSERQLALIEQLQHGQAQDNEQDLVGNPLLASWGKLGRDFLYALTALENNEISAFMTLTRKIDSKPHSPYSLLTQIQHNILNLSYTPFEIAEQDNSIVIQSCHSPMREVEVLHDHLLNLFEQDPSLTPKDIVVMVADIDHYAPYINAVFGQYRQDKRFIPFSLSDGRLTENDVLVAGFLTLLQMKESDFSAEQVLSLLDIPAIRNKFSIDQGELAKLRYWVEQAGIRFGLQSQDKEPNYNSWQKGLERMLLGYAMREENGIWQDSIGFNPSYGLSGEVVGQLAHFVAKLQQWYDCLSQPHNSQDWHIYLKQLLDDFFTVEPHQQETLLYLYQSIEAFSQQLSDIHYTQKIDIDVIAEVFTEKLHNTQHSLRFLVGNVSFCTLLPMRAIPFRVICLLGMNDRDYPRQQPKNSFDLMQYHQQKGDRLRREDDRYLFLEALLSARQQFYISYVGRSIIDNEAKEPSVLVNQLLDYIDENTKLEGESIRERLVTEQAMQIFNPKKNKNNHRTLSDNFTFASQWVPVLQRDIELTEFIQPLQPNQQSEHKLIELSQLIAFVKNPVKFFFERHLGVYFQQNLEQIAEQENFVLNNLDIFSINQQLLMMNEEEWEGYFEQLKVKGVLPLGNFGHIYAQDIQQQVKLFKQQIAPYLAQQPTQRFISLSFAQGGLEGNIDKLYGEKEQRVAWRLGRIRDEDRIENWLYYLALQASVTEKVDPAIFYGAKEKPIRTPELTQQQALAQLAIYVEDYQRSAQRLPLIPTRYLNDYFKLISTSASTEEYWQHFQQMAIDDRYSHCVEDPYWQRVLAQSKNLDIEAINQQFLRWFGGLLQGGTFYSD